MTERLLSRGTDWDARQPSPAPATLVCAVTVLGFGLALYWGQHVNVWPLTLAAAVVSLGSAVLLLPEAVQRSADRAAPWSEQSLGRVLAAGVLAGIVLSLATSGGYFALRQLWPPVENEARLLYSMMATETPVWIKLCVLLVVVTTEEIVWRGVLFRSLAGRVSVWGAVAIATVAYSLPQLASGSWLLVLVALGCGCVWTLQRAWTGLLSFPLITHLVWDLWLFFLFPLVEVTPSV